MERVFCTIITRSHLSWALALADSLRVCDAELRFCMLITDAGKAEVHPMGGRPGVEVVCLDDMRAYAMGAAIATKYADQSDELRWSMKPVLMEHLLARYGKVIYGDCDLHFYADIQWMWSALNTHAMLLTPHWRSGRASIDRANFDLLFVGGLYNAGFVAAQRAALPALRFWAANCLEICVKDFTKGQYVDQTHLNLLPVYFEDIHVLKHRGCNVANWNMVECARVRVGDAVMINGKDPIVFIHFTRSMIDGIVSGEDGALLPHLTILRDRMLAAGAEQDIIASAKARLAARTSPPPGGVKQRLGRAVKRLTGGEN